MDMQVVQRARRQWMRASLLIAALGGASACAGAPTAPATHDLVVVGGRVMDPESGLDAIRHLGIRGGKVVTISESPLSGARVIEATGHVVSPGFVDLHEHGQQDESYRMMVRDGVTSAFELEAGTADVAGWYAARQGGQIVNYGVSVGHIPARMRVLRDPGTGLLPAGVGGTGTATEAQVAQMEDILRKGLAEGAVAVGMGSAYTPGAPLAELVRMFRVAAAGGASVHIHLRGGLAGLHETIGLARESGAALHVVHVNSVARDEIDGFLSAIQAARDAKLDVTTEAYPYGAGMTEIQSALFDDWETWPDEKFGQHQLVSTGERLTRATFATARRAGGTIIIHNRSDAQTRAAIVSPLSMIASDGFIEHGRGHPRTSGTYAKVLGQYVRDEGAIPLMDALRRMTIEPARRIEKRAPAMAGKGRIRIGADADLTIFDPATVKDRATYEDAGIPSAGIPYVIVGGQLVVDNGVITTARPGRAVRGPMPQPLP
jgi:N-acyl-D-aspartate/D-glutamate deacylase